MDSITDINSLLIECVKAIGKYEADRHGFVDEKKRPAGSKYVGATLWPEKEVQQAQTLLLNCLNPDRAEKLNPDQAYLIEKMARDRGCHLAINFRCEDMSYTQPTPLQPIDEKEQVMRTILEKQDELATLIKKFADVK